MKLRATLLKTKVRKLTMQYCNLRIFATRKREIGFFIILQPNGLAVQPIMARLKIKIFYQY
jgi:hypothetical protein